jgi:hypothetical protein
MDRIFFSTPQDTIYDFQYRNLKSGITGISGYRKFEALTWLSNVRPDPRLRRDLWRLLQE